MTPTQSRIQEIAERCEKATPKGPWVFDKNPHNDWLMSRRRLVGMIGSDFHQDTKDFIAHSISDIPFLLEQLTDAVEVIDGMCRNMSLDWYVAQVGKHDIPQHHTAIVNQIHNEDVAYRMKIQLQKARDFLKEMRSDE